MAQTASTAPSANAEGSSPSGPSNQGNFSKIRNWFRKSQGVSAPPAELPRAPESLDDMDEDDPRRFENTRRGSRKPAIPGLPRVQTFKRQQSEKRNNLAPIQPTLDERRAASVDRRVQQSRALSQPAGAAQAARAPRASAPEFLEETYEIQSAPSVQASPVEERFAPNLAQMVHSTVRPQSIISEPHDRNGSIAPSIAGGVPESVRDVDDVQSITDSQFHDMINDELEKKWILNLSMHFRDKSKREKFFVTYRQDSSVWRRVTVSVDYRNAPDGSLERDLATTKYQRDKSAKIYEAIRDSLQDIQFYESVTNLKLQTLDGRLHVHVVEDVNEIINYPYARQIQHLGCRRVKESELEFDSHMSGFVYRVRVDGHILIKKEIPGPDTIDEFLYEINALNRLRFSHDVIPFYGVVVDDREEFVKGLLIGYAEDGALIDVLYENRVGSESGTPWPVRARWARQIVQGLSDIHESGFVQGDFTLSNIVIDDHGDAKIIDINRRGCPVGWEPPEAAPLIDCGQPIRMYIGVKSDLYQLGMVLWALATQDDEPENSGRPLTLGPELEIPRWYRDVVEICLSEDPRMRYSALTLLGLFPDHASDFERMDDAMATSISVEEGGQPMREYFIAEEATGGPPHVRTVGPAHNWPATMARQPRSVSPEPYYYTRGRSPPSPLPSNKSNLGGDDRSREPSGWAGAKYIQSSYSDAGRDDDNYSARSTSATPTTNRDSLGVPAISCKESMSDVSFSDATPKADEVAITVSDLTSDISSLGVPEHPGDTVKSTTPEASAVPNLDPDDSESRADFQVVEQPVEPALVPLPDTPLVSACSEALSEVLTLPIAELVMQTPPALQDSFPSQGNDNCQQTIADSRDSSTNVQFDLVGTEDKTKVPVTSETQEILNMVNPVEEGKIPSINTEPSEASAPPGSTAPVSLVDEKGMEAAKVQDNAAVASDNEILGQQKTKQDLSEVQPESNNLPTLPLAGTGSAGKDAVDGQVFDSSPRGVVSTDQASQGQVATHAAHTTTTNSSTAETTSAGATETTEGQTPK